MDNKQPKENENQEKLSILSGGMTAVGLLCLIFAAAQLVKLGDLNGFAACAIIGTVAIVLGFVVRLASRR